MNEQEETIHGDSSNSSEAGKVTDLQTLPLLHEFVVMDRGLDVVRVLALPYERVIQLAAFGAYCRAGDAAAVTSDRATKVKLWNAAIDRLMEV